MSRRPDGLTARLEAEASAAHRQEEESRTAAVDSLTEKERKWIASLKRVCAKMPESLWALVAYDSVTVYKDQPERGQEVGHVSTPRIGSMKDR